MPYLGNYSGAPSVSPSPASGGDFLRDSARPGAFGVQVDEAQQQLGQQISKVGSVAQEFGNNLQDQYNAAAGTNVENWYNLQTAKRTAEHNQLTGSAAIADAEPYQQYLQDMKQKALDLSPNGAVTRLVSPHLDRIATGLTISSFQHVAAQTKAYDLSETKARGDIATNKAAAADSDGEFENQLAIRKVTDEKAASILGLGPEGVAKAVMDGQTVARAGKLATLSETGQADKAMKLYEDWQKKGLMADEAGKVYNQLYAAQVKESGQRFANDATSGDYFTTLGKKENPSGDPTATPGTSSAGGLFQFTKGTWQETANKHPELNLTEADRTGTSDAAKAKQQAAVQAFDQDNQDILKERGLPVNQKNRYIMHFMGQAGGPKFLEAVVSDPDASAAQMFPAAAEANPSVFYKPDGSARSLKDVYNLQTKTFGTGQLTAFSTEKQVGDMERDARAVAEAKFPGDASAADTFARLVRGKYNDQLYDFNQAKNTNLTIMRDIAFADSIHPPSMADVMNNPQFAAAAKNIKQIPGGDAILGAFEKSLVRAKLDEPMTPEREELVKGLEGLRAGQPDQFVKQNVWELDLPWKVQKEIVKQQQHDKDIAAGDPAVGAAIGYLDSQGKLASVGLKKPAKGVMDPNWTKFQGDLTYMMKNWMVQHPGSVPGNKEIDDMAGSIFASRPGSGWFGSNVGMRPEFRGDVPPEEAKTIQGDFVRRFGQAEWDKATKADPILLNKLYANKLYLKQQKDMATQ